MTLRAMTLRAMMRAIIAAMLALLGVAPAHAQETRQVIIGTAASSGVYGQVGAALCRLARPATGGVRCRAEVSGGSRANIAGLLSGDIQLALVQGNVLYDAAHGLGSFSDLGPRNSLRTVMRLYDEQLTIVARSGAGIAALGDLRGKRVSLGPEGSGSRLDAIRLLQQAGMSVDDFGAVLDLSPDEHDDALCAGRIDAYFFVVGHPNRNTRHPVERCGGNLVPVPQEVIQRFVGMMPSFSASQIPGGLYARHPNPIPTVSVAAMLVATADTPADVVAMVIRGVQDNLRDFRRLHPVLAGFSDARAFDSSLAPMHPGTLDRRVAPPATATDLPAAERATITIVHFADVADVEPLASSGDLPRIATIIAREKAANPNVIVAHGGNALSPSFIAALDEGAYMTRMLNQMLVDVMVANIHEFDFGPDVAEQRLRELSFPVLGANVMDGGRRAPGYADGVVIAQGGFRIGLVGGVRADTALVSNPGRLRFAALVPALQAAAEAMRAQGADVVVALCAGVAAECEAALVAPGIDIVLGSGGPGRADASTDGRRVMLRSGTEGNIVAALDLDFVRTPRDIGVDVTRGADPLRMAIDAVPTRSEDVVTWTATTRLIDSRGMEPDQLIEIISQIELDNASLPLNEIVATLTGGFSSRFETMRRQESAVADLVADALRERAGADVALINAGMIRGNRDYDAGTPIRLRALVEELPFANELAVVTMTGAALREALEHGLAMLPAPAARFPQVAGMTVRFDPARPAGRRVLAVEIGGRPLDPRRRYRVATSSFLVGGGDGYAMIAASPRVALAGDPLVIRDVVVAHVRRLGTVPPPPAGRLREATR